MINPVILCGGSGTRLWPLSRKSFPKQFVNLVGSESLFQASARRLSGEGFARPILITASDYRFIVAEQLNEVGIDPGVVLIEPEARNTAPAVLAAALLLANTDPDALMLVSPSDHVVADAEAFRLSVQAGLASARSGRIVTFGIRPTRAETGYGWLELAGPARDGLAADLVNFVEKPERFVADEMLAQGNYLWNSGIFLFSAKAIIQAFEKCAPDLVPPVAASVSAAKADLGFLRLDPSPWSAAEAVSIDYAVMEKSKNLTVVPFSAGWSDLGGWDAVRSEMEADVRGNALGGNALAIDCDATLLRSESEGLELVGIGLKDIIAIATHDAVLVTHHSRSQDVKKAVEILRSKGAKQAQSFPRDHRPWGWFETLALANRFQVKRIVVKPGAALSLQSHMHRSEHWIVVSGTAKVVVDDTVQLLGENQSVYIPLGAKHRLENPGRVPMTLIEVQTGAYLGEDDIVRYEDIYARGQGAKG